MRGTLKYMLALDIAFAEGFEWDYERAEAWELYAALEELGYDWDREQGRWFRYDA